MRRRLPDSRAVVGTMSTRNAAHRPVFDSLERRRLLATFIVLNTNDAGESSLRDAMDLANMSGQASTIEFRIPTQSPVIETLVVNSPLPVMTVPISIDATTQLGYSQILRPVVELRPQFDQGNAAFRGAGLVLRGGNSSVLGLAIGGFDGEGILLSGGSNRILGSYVGTDATGTVAVPNAGDGVLIQGGTGDQIGGPGLSERNILSGNGGSYQPSRSLPAAIGSVAVVASAYQTGTDRSLGSFVATSAISGSITVDRSIDGVNFQRIQTLGSNSPDGIVSGDFNADGLNDLAVSSNNSRQIQVFLCQADGTFSALTPIDLDGSPSPLVVGNFNGDSLPDLAVAVSSSDSVPPGIAVFLGLGDGLFSQGATTPTDRFLTSITTGRLFGSSVDDIAGVNEEPSTLTVLKNDGLGGFSVDSTTSLTHTPSRIVSGEFVTAGVFDLAVSDKFNSTVTILNNLGNGSFSESSPMPAGAFPSAMATGDFNGDGLTDLVVADSEINSSSLLLFQHGPTSLIPTLRIPVGPGPLGVSIADLDGDGRPDFSTAQSEDSTVGLVLSRNSARGLHVVNATGTTVQGNLIGIDVTATNALSNYGGGIGVEDSSGVVLGGEQIGQGNVISANGVGVIPGSGISVVRSPSTLIAGNRIGADVRGNSSDGISLVDSRGAIIGGAGGFGGNLISGNGGSGILVVGIDSAGTGIYGNRIGTDALGLSALSNAQSGVTLAGGANLVAIGGDGVGQGNLISGNGVHGVVLTTGSNRNTLVGNRIGTDAAGQAAIPNAQAGVALSGVDVVQNQIGSRTPFGMPASGEGYGSGNLISGNAAHGIQLLDGTTGNEILSNFIGSNFDGTRPIGNAQGGIVLMGANPSGNIIGDLSDFRGPNLISGNGLFGVLLSGVGTTLLRSNLIGTTADGQNALGNSGSGVIVQDSQVVIGGAVLGYGNTISSNELAGLLITGGGSSGLRVGNNRVGVGSTSLVALGNGAAGIVVAGGASQTQIGYGDGEGGFFPNLVAANSGPGVLIAGAGVWGAAAGIGNSVLGNSIFFNAGLAIDLGPVGPTQNVPGNPPGGPNDLQNHPVFDHATLDSAGGLDVGGTLGSRPNSTYRIQFYVSATLTAGDRADGRTLLAQSTVTTDAAGNAPIAAYFPAGTSPGVAIGAYFGATATAEDGSTSEFSVGTLIDDLSFTVINTNDSGRGSLRQAILNSNIHPGRDTIDFKIPGPGPFTIPVKSPLPALTDPAALDAATQPGYVRSPIVEITPASPTVGGDGLVLVAGNTLVRGLVINRFAGAGIRIEGAGQDQVEGCYIGLDLSGQTGLGNSGDGVLIRQSDGNVIGGQLANSSNVISGNNGRGVRVLTSAGTRIEANLIGTNLNGNTAIGNALSGLSLEDSALALGGLASGGVGNLISGNGGDGISIFGVGSSGSSVASSQIGTDRTGSIGLGNLGAGIRIDGASSVTIGSGPASLRNLIAANLGPGILVAATRGAVAGTSIVGNDIGSTTSSGVPLGNSVGIVLAGVAGTTIGGTGQGLGNRVTQNRIGGIEAFGGSTSTLIQQNLIGQNGFGIALHGATGTQIGGDTPNASNTLTSNAGDGIILEGAGTSANLISGNHIGVDAVGIIGQGNAVAGIRLRNAPANTIGGLAPGTGNLISGNTGDGLVLEGQGSNTNLVASNFVGLDINGAGLGNGGDGISLVDAPDNTIGSPTTAPGNVVSGNAGIGIALRGAGSTGNWIIRNHIGTNPAGTIAVANAVGIALSGASRNTIGGPNSTDVNLVSGNRDAGIQILLGSGGNRVLGNTIGLDATGQAILANGTYGIIVSNSGGNVIGGPGFGMRNLISGNESVGLSLVGASSTSNVVSGNLVGTDSTGTLARGNGDIGILADNAPGNTIGGLTSSSGNLISGNGQIGLELAGLGTFGTTIVGNRIGTTFDGSRSLGNGSDGIFLNGSPRNQIGGTAAGSMNLVSGNLSTGIQLFGPGASGNVIEGNWVGLDATGRFALANRFGLFLNNAGGNRLGGRSTGSGNVVSGNAAVGVELAGLGSAGNSIQGNNIGGDVSGTRPIGNDVGLFLAGAGVNTVGGTQPGARNTLLGNRVDLLETPATTTTAKVAVASLRSSRLTLPAHWRRPRS
ncbi:NosD domain-containing protein [Isosphaeraceae bacterium EP7]